MSTIHRLHVSDELALGAEIELETAQAHYLQRVLRLDVGASIRLFNGRDGEWLAEILTAHRGRVLVTPRELSRHQPDHHAAPTLLFAPLKKTRTDFAVEKATELGARRIQPIITKRTQTKQIRNDRLESLVREAAEQTERLELPTIEPGIPLFQALENWNPDEPLVFCDEAGDDQNALWGGEHGRALPMAEVISQFSSANGGVLIGPEGGFTLDERTQLKNLNFVYAVSLGPRILRAETAVVCALTIWQTELGDWR